MEIYDFLFNSRMGLLALFIGGLILFTVIALVLERGTRSKYRDRPKPKEDVTFKKANRPVKSQAQRDKEREERIDEVRDAISEGGIAGLLGIGIEDDEDDE